MEICTSWYTHKTKKFADINLSVERNYCSLKYYIKQTANKAFIDIKPWLCTWLYETVSDVWPSSYFSLVRSAEVMRRQLHHPKQICKAKDEHCEDKKE
jgi:hypothetical protein